MGRYRTAQHEDVGATTVVRGGQATNRSLETIVSGLDVVVGQNRVGSTDVRHPRAGQDAAGDQVCECLLLIAPPR